MAAKKKAAKKKAAKRTVAKEKLVSPGFTSARTTSPLGRSNRPAGAYGESGTHEGSSTRSYTERVKRDTGRAMRTMKRADAKRKAIKKKSSSRKKK